MARFFLYKLYLKFRKGLDDSGPYQYLYTILLCITEFITFILFVQLFHTCPIITGSCIPIIFLSHSVTNRVVFI